MSWLPTAAVFTAPSLASVTLVTLSPASSATGGTFDVANYLISYAGGLLTVNPAALTITADSTSKTYGQTVTFAGSEFSALGLQNGESVGSVTLASAGSVAAANVAGSPYAITAANAIGGTFDAANYLISYADGALTVNPATLTYLADPKSRLYGDANPALTGSVAGFQNGETLTGATTGTLAFTTAATATSNVGSYAITGSGLASINGNYIFTQAAANATALTVSPATLTYLADPASRLFGVPNPAYTGQVTGFKNGETVAGATTGTLAFTSPALTFSLPGTYAINGAGLAANSGNYVFAQDPSNATALTVLDNPNALPLTTLQTVLKEGDLGGDGVFDQVEGAPAARPSELDVGGIGTLGEDPDDAKLSDPRTKQCLLKAANVPQHGGCETRTTAR